MSRAPFRRRRGIPTRRLFRVDSDWLILLAVFVLICVTGSMDYFDALLKGGK